MKPFAFVGRLAASKSIMNRALLAQSYSGLKIHGDSNADDVRLMKGALAALEAGHEMHAGAAGTVLRFMALRASRVPGQHRISGERRLFARAPEELLKVLRQLGVRAELGADFLRLEGEGWKLQGDTLLVPSQRSSQFVSAVLLNAWNLPFDLYVSTGGRKVSEGYWRMSVKMAQDLGMRIDFWDGDFRIPRGQRISASELRTEIDMSSAFALAALAAVNGQATILEFPSPSMQPDSIFPEILARMGVPLLEREHTLKVERASRLNGVAMNLNTTPDLFPVLAALAALAHGESDLHGAPHLVHKESNRLEHLARWIRALGREVETKDDGLRILGDGPLRPGPSVVLDCDGDHRLAFAAAVFKAAGLDVDIRDSGVVSKSFPEFWDILGWRP